MKWLLGHLRIVLVLTLLGAGAAWWFVMKVGPPPPMLDDLSGIDDEVRQLIVNAADQVRSHRGSRKARVQLGMVYDVHDYHEIALECYYQAVRRGGDAKDWYKIALAHHKLGEVDQSFAALQRSIDRDAKYAPSIRRWGNWLLEVGKTVEAESAFRRALELDESDPGAGIGLARVFMQQRKGQQAVDILEAQLGGPNDAYVYGLLGTALRQVGRGEESRQALARSASMNPRWSDPWEDEVSAYATGVKARWDRANGFVRAGQFAQALPHLVRLHQDDPRDTLVLNMLGPALIETGEAEQGLAMLEQALEVNGGDFQTHMNLAEGIIIARTGPEAWTLALEHAGRAVHFNPMSAKASQVQGEMLLRLNRKDEAIEPLLRAFELDTRSLSAAMQASGALYELRRFDETRIALEKILGAYPGHPEALRRLAIVHVDEGNLDAAQQALDRIDMDRVENSAPIERIQQRIEQLRTAARSPSEPAPPGGL